MAIFNTARHAPVDGKDDMGQSGRINLAGIIIAAFFIYLGIGVVRGINNRNSLAAGTPAPTLSALNGTSPIGQLPTAAPTTADATLFAPIAVQTPITTDPNQIYQPLLEVGNAFMTAIQQNNFANAYQLMAPDFAASITPEQLQILVMAQGLLGTQAWNFDVERLRTLFFTDSVDLTGIVQLIDGKLTALTLSMRLYPQGWRVMTFTNQVIQ